MKVVLHDQEKNNQTNKVIIRHYRGPENVKKEFRICHNTYQLTSAALEGTTGFWLRKNEKAGLFGITDSKIAQTRALVLCCDVVQHVHYYLQGDLSLDDLQEMIDLAASLLELLSYHQYISDDVEIPLFWAQVREILGRYGFEVEEIHIS